MIMNDQFSFTEDEMNGIVEDTYKKLMNHCNKLQRETNCKNEQIIALLSLIASNFTNNLTN